MGGTDRYRDPLSSALRRSDRQSGGQARVRKARTERSLHPQFSRCTRLHRSRDADVAADRWRRDGAAVRDTSQRARSRSVSAHRAGTVPQATGRWRFREGLREDRKSVVSGKSVSVRVYIGGRRTIKKKKRKK